MQAMMVTDTTLLVGGSGPYVQFADGDVLPGQIVTPPEDADRPMSDEKLLFVELATPLRTKDRTNSIWIHGAAVARIVTSPSTDTGPSPGRVTLRDGRQLRAQSVRFREDGIDILSDRAITPLTWDAIAELNVPRLDLPAALVDTLREPPAAPTEEAKQPLPHLKDRMVRIVMTNGATFTSRLDRVVRFSYWYDNTLHYELQPAWCESRILAPVSEIITRYYYQGNAIPLTLLPYEVLTRRSLTGHCPPVQIGSSQRGEPPAIGRFEGDLAIGMHAHCEMAFELPVSVTGFTSWVGIDRAARHGGCVRCRIYKDEVQGRPIWESGIIRGGQAPLRVQVDNLEGARRLILVADYAADDHPDDADPLDIRDEVDWIFPYVQVAPPVQKSPEIGER